MKTVKLFAGLVIGASLLFAGCEKYVDGGKVNKAEDNLTRTWHLDAYYVNGNNLTGSMIASDYIEVYQTNGIYTRTSKDSDGNTLEVEGTWALAEENSKVILTNAGVFELSDDHLTVTIAEYTINQLTETDLWYTFLADGVSHQFRLKAH
ncbi:MAG: hypothetical protein IPM74_07795 [Crocinitomicaceae bacterium]|nr:hypothetical protein [Crocinitomicaceae bacterium]MBK8925802.1 hypothetical protein [Crocinitomicaceae bacterium]